MTRSLSRIGLLAVLSIGFIASASATVYEKAVDAISTGYRIVREFALNVISGALALAPAKAGEAVSPEPQRRLLAAKQFVLRFIKRDKPQMTDSFRWCPSI